MQERATLAYAQGTAHFPSGHRTEEFPGSAVLRGAEKMRSGAPDSTTFPPSNISARSETSRANLISWVTHSSVMSGRMASARATATRCCRPPESRVG